MMGYFADGPEMSLRTLELRHGSRHEGDAPGQAPDRAGRAPAGKWLATAFSIAMIAAVASPVLENWKAQPRDGFPLSYYRMFSEERADTQRLTYLVGLDGRGNRYLIPYRFAGAGGMNQVRRQINKLVAQGQADRLCQTVATRLARSAGRLPDLDTVEVITGTYRLSSYFTGNNAPVAEQVRARCRAGRARS